VRRIDYAGSVHDEEEISVCETIGAFLDGRNHAA